MLPEQIELILNVKRTENGAIGHSTTGKALLDLNFQVPSLRGADPNRIISLFDKAFKENPELAMKWLFFSRDVRGGLGEKDILKVCMEAIGNKYPEQTIALIPLMPVYGRFDDIFCLRNTPCWDAVLAFINEQLTLDLLAMQEQKPISLLGKWLPSINTSSADTRALAYDIVKAFGLTPRLYRKTLATLRAYLDVPEVKMSAGRWAEINYEAVCSRANLIYRNAFLRHDADGRTAYLEALEQGKAKINSAVLFPHEIVSKYNHINYSYYSTAEDKALEEMWKALPDTVLGNEGTLVVADGSGSMMCGIDRKSNTTALDVANALAIYFAERAKGVFKNTYITFSSRPQLVRLGNGSLRNKLNIAKQYNEVANTNIEAVFSLILTTAVKNNLPQSEMPKNVLIISDMEFDSATRPGWNDRSFSGFNKTLFESIADRFAAAGYTLPRLSFWNVNGRTNTIPVVQNDAGVALVSGFSTNIVKMVMSAKTDPYEILLEQLMAERYAPITFKV